MNEAAKTPPMGWNSWDCYGASVTEEEVRGNAEFMAQNLKPFGWEYMIVDIQWYEPEADGSKYRPFAPLAMDDHSRLIPAVNRFPSSAGGRGFRPLADYVHSLGLKFGIHIMRGIPRQAVHAHAPVSGTDRRADEIAHTASICAWNTDMYGVDANKPGAQEYYDSIFELYAQWNVDYVKVDDCSYNFIADGHYCAGEVELLHNAIAHSGRDMVLSLSPGPAPLEKAEHLKKYANMWRMTDDFWDDWNQLLEAFERCDRWSAHVGAGHWPDADMLPLGHIGIRSSEHGAGDRMTRFTQDEQITLMTLWCIFRSPLMFGGEMRNMDGWTRSLLTNPEVLNLLKASRDAKQLLRSGPEIVWGAAGDGCRYAAVFNVGENEETFDLAFSTAGMKGACRVRDLWARGELGKYEGGMTLAVPPHGARLLCLEKL